MAKRRQLVLLRYTDPDDPASGPASLGSPEEFVGKLAPFNTAPDGSPGRGATRTLYGPGMNMDIALSSDEVGQALVSCYDDELAWPVLSGVCRKYGWKLQDVETGQVFG